MSSLASSASVVQNVVGQGVGLSKSAGLLQGLTGQPGKVSIIAQSGGLVVQLLEVEVTTNEAHNKESTVTTNPLESDGVVSDHIIKNPWEISITGLISDTPLYDYQRFVAQSYGNALSSVLPPLGIIEAAVAYKSAYAQKNVQKRSLGAYKSLVALLESSSMFTLITNYQRYANMVLKALSFPRDAQTSTVCAFTLSMTQIELVTPQYVEITALKNPNLAAERKEGGELSAEEQEILNQDAKGEALGVKTGKTINNAAAKVGDVAQAGFDKLGLGG